MSNEHKVERQLSLYLNESDQLPDCLYLYGQKSVGKSFFLQKFLKKHKWLKSVIINTSECYNSRILFETIINTFNDHHPSEENAYTSFGKVDSIEDFLSELSNMNSVESYAVVIENAEKLRDMEFNIFPVFSKLPEFTGLNIICIFVSHLAYEKLGSPANIIEIHVPDFTKDDIVSILSSKYKETHCKIIKSIEKNASLSVDERNVQLAIAVNLDEAFYKNYLVTFLNVFYKACRDITELQFISYKCYVSYYTPVLKGEIEYTDVTNLYRNISKVLKQSLQTGHMRIGNLTEKQIIAGEENSLEPTKENHVRSFAQTLELPFFAKYLLIASFLASHNDAKFDKRLFMKHHGKERKRQQKAKVSGTIQCFNYFNKSSQFLGV